MFGKKEEKLHGQKIENYAVIGDFETAALVGLNGSIDWLCWPNFASSACFAALLGKADHGYWKLAPEAEVKATSRRYMPDSVVVETTMETADGAVMLIDFMPLRGESSDLVRLVRGLRGKVKMRMDLAIRFDYGRTIPWVTHTKEGVRAISGPDMVVLRTAVAVKGEGDATVASFAVREGEEVTFTLTYGPSVGKNGREPDDPVGVDPKEALESTLVYWRNWNAKTRFMGQHAAAVQRSLMTMKVLTYEPSGGIVAAVTTSLPEKIGGERNWDYRYCWLRDTAFTLLALLQAGYEEEAESWRRWLLRAVAGAPAQLQTIYGICGERQMNEWKADWLPGYEHSKPVLIGNAASEQFQLDVFGEVVAALAKMPTAGDDIRVSSSSVLGQLVDHLCQVWDQPDDGIWETRGGRKHFTFSKVMAWVALDRAIRHHEEFDGAGDVKVWREESGADPQAGAGERIQ